MLISLNLFRRRSNKYSNESLSFLQSIVYVRVQTNPFQVHVNKAMLKQYDDMLDIISSNTRQNQIIDARPPNSFYGSISIIIID
jgi:3-mercaptopyruvate sulfurtransferase SseA